MEKLLLFVLFLVLAPICGFGQMSQDLGLSAMKSDSTTMILTNTFLDSTRFHGLTLPYAGSVASNKPAFSVTNTGSGSAGLFQINNMKNVQPALQIRNDGIGPGCLIEVDTLNDQPAFQVKSNGEGSCGTFEVNNIKNKQSALHVKSNGLGDAGFFWIGNSANGHAAIRAITEGIGSAGYFRSRPSHSNSAFEAVSEGEGPAAQFSTRNSDNGSPALVVFASGTREAAAFHGNVKIICEGKTVVELGEGLDYSEGFDVSHKNGISPGSVLSIDPNSPGKLTLSDKPYDSKVAGIVTGARGLGSGVRLGLGQFDYNVALAGRVYCNVDATEAEVEPGDLLTTSVSHGYAMKASDYERARGAILGKAMERLEKGKKGQILVLVTLQ